jgi:quinoprotein dehydrogenase-associated probable ABC transporter substrate-binding protein
MAGPAGRLGAALLVGLGLLATPAAGQAPPGAETVDPARLRVCADPANLPFSDDQGRGFENRIAELLAAHLGRPLSYTWHPQSMGFVRNTLRPRLCDLIIGVVAADELVLNTNPYYRSAYVLVHRAGEADRFGDLERPAVRGARIGAVAGTPPVDLLARLGLLAHLRPYRLMVDTRAEQPARAMLADLAAGEIDIALAWGPIAGYWARRQAVPLELVPLASDPRRGPRLDFWISMGVRQGEPEWKHRINEAIAALQPQIDAVLDEYAVPRLDRQSRLVGVWAREGAAAVPGPAGGG